jgi:hypothetical protein
MSEEQDEVQELEVVPVSAIEASERAQVDIQIATARKYGRELSKVKKQMLSNATLDEETASSCFYTLPARKGGDGKPLQGPSIRLAEIALACYQHIRAGARVISDDGNFIVAQAMVHDLYNNVCITREVRRRVTNKNGQRYSDDMIATTGNAACSIALRNATFTVVPRALITPVYEEAKRLAVGDIKSLTQKRAQVVERFIQMGVRKELIPLAVGVTSIEDIDLAKLETLIGYGTAIKEGAAKIEEIFTVPQEVKQPSFLKPEGCTP